jgi:outer membrane protein assembly factor BamB
MKYFQSLRTLAAYGLILNCSEAADWRQFRGNESNSVAAEDSLPTELSGDSITWKTPLPGRGLSGPIIVSDRVFLTASSGHEDDRLHVLCFDAASGKSLWERQFGAMGRTMTYETMSNATPTMASDGERVFAFYSSNDLICLDLDGRLQWYRGFGSEFPNASNSLGMSSSPLVVGSTVIVQVESDAEAFACGVDTLSGETKWKIERPRAANWTSPSILPATSGSPALALLQSSKGLTAVDPETGKVVWNFDQGASTIPSATVYNGAIVIPSKGLTTIRPAADSFEQVWNAADLSPATSSPVVVGDMAFVLNSSGVLSAGSTVTGERLWQLRLRGKFSSTPLAGSGHLFAFSEAGVAFVVKPEADKGQIVSELDLAETIMCSPGAADNALFIRSDRHLYRMAQPK